MLLVASKERLITEQQHGVAEVGVEGAHEVLGVGHLQEVTPEETPEDLGELRLARASLTSEDHGHLARAVGLLDRSGHPPNHVVVVLQVARADVVANVLQVGHVTVPGQGIAGEPAPKVVGVHDLLVGSEDDGVILPTGRVEGPPGAQGLEDRVSTLLIHADLDAAVVVAVAEVFERLLGDAVPFHHRVIDLADDAALPADVPDDCVLLVQLPQVWVNRLFLRTFDLADCIRFPPALFAHTRGNLVGSGDDRKDHLFRDLRAHEVTTDLEQGFGAGAVLARVQRVLARRDQRQRVIADHFAVLARPLLQLLGADRRDVAGDPDLGLTTHQPRLLRLDADRRRELVDVVLAIIVPLHQRGQRGLATLLQLARCWNIDRTRDSHNPIHVMRVIGTQDSFQLDIVGFQFFRSFNTAVDLQLRIITKFEKPLVAPARKNYDSGFGFEVLKGCEYPHPFLFRVFSRPGV